ncbi:MAG: hypothetical protein JWP35_492 [Caulobacter sp.]|nr:hypothetical protein [Caulobacter sp.]
MKLSTLAAAASALAIATAFAASAHAADTATGFSGELGAAVAHTSDGGVDLNLTSVILRGGYQFNENFALEGEASFGVGDDSDSGVKFHQDYEVGAFLVGSIPAGDKTQVLARVGYAQSKIKGSFGGFSATDTVNGAAVGLGVKIFPTGSNNGFRLDYTHYFFDHDSAVDGASVTWVHKF